MSNINNANYTRDKNAMNDTKDINATNDTNAMNERGAANACDAPMASCYASAAVCAAAVADAEGAANTAAAAAFERRFNTFGMLFCVAAASVFVTLGGWLQMRDVVSGLLVTEFGIILGCAVLYAAITRQDFKSFFRLRSAKFSVYVKVFFMGIFALPISMALNAVAVYIITQFGTYATPELPIASEASGLFMSIFTIAVSAGICEEFMFRGALLSSFEKNMGYRKAAIISAVLFGLFHFNLGNLLSPIFLGLVFAHVTQTTGSIFPAVFGHFMNNTWAVLLGFWATKKLGNEELAVAAGASASGTITPAQFTVIAVILLAVIVVCALAIRVLLRSIKRSYPKRRSELIGAPVEERLDYVSEHYSLWESRRGAFGIVPALLMLLLVAAYSFLQYIQFFGTI